MNKMKKFTIIGSLIAVVLCAIGFIVRDRIYNQKMVNIAPEEKQENQLQSPSISTPTEKPLYFVEIESTPTLNSYGFTYKAILKNILVKPFITHFGFYECNFIDKGGNRYPGMLFDTNTFQKAILPNASKEFTANDVRADISGFEHNTEGFQKCAYDETGKYICKLINDFKIIDCTGYISTDEKGAGGAHGGTGGQFPIKVTFPTN
jgi:hypothetical protein